MWFVFLFFIFAFFLGCVFVWVGEEKEAKGKPRSLGFVANRGKPAWKLPKGASFLWPDRSVCGSKEKRQIAASEASCHASKGC